MQRRNKNKNSRILQFLSVLKEIEKLEDNTELKASQLVSFLSSSLPLSKRMAHHYIDVLTKIGKLERVKWGRYKIKQK